MCARPDCGHPRAIHAGDACRINGCTCTGFDGGKTRPVGPRRVSIDIPDGYMFSVTLTPWDPALAAEAWQAERDAENDNETARGSES